MLDTCYKQHYIRFALQVAKQLKTWNLEKLHMSGKFHKLMETVSNVQKIQKYKSFQYQSKNKSKKYEKLNKQKRSLLSTNESLSIVFGSCNFIVKPYW